jgi:hypothetical protein
MSHHRNVRINQSVSSRDRTKSNWAGVGAQVAWLKQRDAAPSIEEKNRRVLARIKALQDLLW